MHWTACAMEGTITGVWHSPLNRGTHSTVLQSQEGPKPHHRAHGAGLLLFQAQDVELSADTEACQQTPQCFPCCLGPPTQGHNRRKQDEITI